MRTIRWGIIGCGAVTEVKSGPGFQQAENSQLVAVMRRTASLAEDYARRHGVPRWHDDADEIIAADDIDSVYVATPPDTHRDYVLRCAAAGKPVYVEKPMAADHAECLEMIEACRSAGVPLWVGYYRRALPRFLAVQQLIMDGAIGDVRAVRLERYEPLADATDPANLWRLDPSVSRGGLFFDGDCHALDVLDLLFGPVAEVNAVVGNRGGTYDAVDTVCADLRFESGVLGSGFWCYAADEGSDTTVIYGSKGRLSFSTSRPKPIRLAGVGLDRELSVDDPAHVHQPLIQTIVDELSGQGRCPSTGESAARTAWAMDQILAQRGSLRPEAR